MRSYPTEPHQFGKDPIFLVGNSPFKNGRGNG